MSNLSFPTYKAAKDSLREFSKGSGLRESHKIVKQGSRFYRVLVSKAARNPRRKTKRKITRARRNPSPIAFSPRGRGAQAPPTCPGCGLANPSGAHLLACIKGKGKGLRGGKNVQITFGKRNPYGGYIIIGKARGVTWYLSAMGGFSKHKRFADLFHSSATAQRKARSIVNRLPKQIEYIAVRKSA